MTTPGASRRRDPGFTLIETIVVLVILGLALTIVAGFIPRRNTTLELSAAAARVSGAMRTARAQAVSESRPIPFTVVPDGHGFRVGDNTVNLGPSVAVTMMGTEGILFAKDGSASGGAFLVAVGGRGRVVRVDWLTGRVSVAEAR